MIENLPVYIPVIFLITTFLTLFIFYKASANNVLVLLIILAWMGIQSALSLRGFYLNTTSTPPHFIFLVLPPFLFMIILFFNSRGKKFIDHLELKTLTWLH